MINDNPSLLKVPGVSSILPVEAFVIWPCALSRGTSKRSYNSLVCTKDRPTFGDPVFIAYSSPAVPSQQQVEPYSLSVRNFYNSYESHIAVLSTGMLSTFGWYVIWKVAFGWVDIFWVSVFFCFSNISFNCFEKDVSAWLYVSGSGGVVLAHFVREFIPDKPR